MNYKMLYYIIMNTESVFIKIRCNFKGEYDMWNSIIDGEELIDLYTKDITDTEKIDYDFEEINDYKFDESNILDC